MNVFVPLLIVVVAVCWFLVYTGRVAPTDLRLLLFVVVAMAAGAVFFLYTYVRAGRARAAEMRRVAEGLGWEFAEHFSVGDLQGVDRFQIFAGEAVRGAGGGAYAHCAGARGAWRRTFCAARSAAQRFSSLTS